MDSKATYDLDTVVQQSNSPVAAEELTQLRKENSLLRDVHWAARCMMRHNGIDREATIAAVERLKAAVWTVNDFDLGVEIEVPQRLTPASTVQIYE